MAEPAPTSASASPSSTTINIRETPAVVQWTAQVSDDQALAASDADAVTTHYLARSSNSSPITFSLFFDPSSNAAFFKIRATILVRECSKDRTQASVFLFIYPEHVDSLVHDPQSTLSSEAAAASSKKLSSCRTTCLRFALRKPPSLIAPLHMPLTPRSKKDAQVLRSLTMLANTTAIAVQFAHEALPMSGLMALVCAASAKNALKSSLNHGDLSQLYGGQGGKVLEEGFQDWPVPSAEGENEMAAPEASAGSPPSYDGLYSNPTSSPRPAQSLKRPRAYSGCFDGDADRPDVLSICKKLVVEHMAHLRGELRDELRDELRGELRDEIRGEIKTQIEEQNKGLIERVDRRVDEQIAQLRDDVTWQVDKTEERMDEVERHMDNLIDEGIEDRVLGVKLEMQEYVKDEMAEVEDKIIKHFEDGRVTLQFER